MPRDNRIETITVPHLATVTFDTRNNDNPTVRIVLSSDYNGDIDDLMDENWKPGDVYFEGSGASSIDDPKLAQFLEVCSHWDYNFDGIYDADELAQKILNALRRCRAEAQPFQRPSNGLYTAALMSVMPPPPDRHIVFSYGELKPRFRLQHYLLAIPAIIILIALIQLQIAAVPWTKYSVISGAFALADKIGVILVVALLATYLLLNVFFNARRQASQDRTMSRHTYGFFNRAAIFEEQAFREGAEHWNASQRIISCLAFGAIHMINLIYPLATILPLALGGGLFMWVYLREQKKTRFRRSAVLEASIAHRVYNRIALFVVLTVLLGAAGGLLVQAFLFISALLATWIDMTVVNLKHLQAERAQEPVNITSPAK